ncbi:MAG: amidohydrolase family protein, partial [Roseiarcus sp.]
LLDCVGRRRLLQMMGAMAASTALPAFAQTPAPATPYRIDVHQHIFPPAYLAAERDRIIDASQGVRPAVMIEWTPEKTLEEMDKNAVATSIVSISTPGVYFGDRDEGRRLTRLCNEYGAKLIADHPGRFGMFAAIPLPDTEGSLREIAYALDTLKFSGVGLMTNYGDKWPGDPAFAPVFEELNRRQAAVYFHPTAANCCGHLIPEISSALIEYPTDTTRCISSLLFNGALTKYRDIHFIFAHGGGTLPMLAGRLAGWIPYLPEIAARLPNGPMYELQRLNFDIATVANPAAMAAVLKLVPVSQLLLGSDFPYLSVAFASGGMRKLGIFSDGDLMAIERDNALRLIPHLKA